MHRHPVLTAVTALSAVMALGAAVAAADVVDGYCITYRAPADTFPQTLDATANTLDDRLGSMGIAGHAVAEPGSGTITVQLKPGPTDLAAMTDLAADLGATGILEFVPVPPELQFVVVEGPVPDGMQEMNPLLTGVEIDSASIFRPLEMASFRPAFGPRLRFHRRKLLASAPCPYERWWHSRR
jgi:hypothetical protein